MHFERREEFLMDNHTSNTIKILLQACFPDFPPHQTYFKQVPHSRLLAWEKEELIGHAAIEFRKISVGQSTFKVFLIGDICVADPFQHKKVASKLIKEIENLARKNELAFLVVVVSNPDLYTKNGFQVVDNICRWVIIQNHLTIGVRERSINNSLMIKQVGKQLWPGGVVDFLGYIV